MPESSSVRSGSSFFDILRFVCYGIICALLGYFFVWWIFYLLDGSPGGVCNSLKQSFKDNDTFEFSSCRLISQEDQDSDEIKLVLKIRKGMEVYFDDEPKDLSERELNSTQVEYYCNEFFSRVRVDYLDLTIRYQDQVRHHLKISRDICD
ncbi:MAG: hypothetical protein ACI4VX_04945 [Succinivibrionaceae bacterium]